LRDLDAITGPMGGATLENGWPIKWTVLAYFSGLMEENMKGPIKRIKRRETDYLPGLMGETIMVVGYKENSMEKENIKVVIIRSEQEFGRVAEELVGLKMRILVI
jgi:hypothetical protein